MVCVCRFVAAEDLENEAKAIMDDVREAQNLHAAAKAAGRYAENWYQRSRSLRNYQSMEFWSKMRNALKEKLPAPPSPPAKNRFVPPVASSSPAKASSTAETTAETTEMAAEKESEIDRRSVVARQQAAVEEEYADKLPPKHAFARDRCVQPYVRVKKGNGTHIGRRADPTLTPEEFDAVIGASYKYAGEDYPNLHNQGFKLTLWLMRWRASSLVMTTMKTTTSKRMAACIPSNKLSPDALCLTH